MLEISIEVKNYRLILFEIVLLAGFVFSSSNFWAALGMESLIYFFRFVLRNSHGFDCAAVENINKGTHNWKWGETEVECTTWCDIKGEDEEQYFIREQKKTGVGNVAEHFLLGITLFSVVFFF